MYPAWRSNGTEKAPLHRHPVEKATIGFGSEKVPTSARPQALLHPSGSHGASCLWSTTRAPSSLGYNPRRGMVTSVPTIQFKAMEFHMLLANSGLGNRILAVIVAFLLAWRKERLRPFLSRSRYFLFLLGVQLGKQGVFSVPLDPHARCIRRGRTGGAVGPVRIKKIPSQCTCKVRDTEIAIWPGPLRTLGPRETASPSLPRRRFLPSPRLHRRAVLPTPHSLAGGWGEGTQCCGGVRKNGGHCRPAVWFWFRASHCPLRLPRRLMSCHLTTCPHPTHFFQVHFQLVKYFIAVARVQPIS
jgi:hypothetical protein